MPRRCCYLGAGSEDGAQGIQGFFFPQHKHTFPKELRRVADFESEEPRPAAHLLHCSLGNLDPGCDFRQVQGLGGRLWLRGSHSQELK